MDEVPAVGRGWLVRMLGFDLIQQVSHKKASVSSHVGINTSSKGVQ